MEVIKEKTFHILWLIYFFNTIAIGYINAMGKSFGQTFIRDDHFLAVIVSLAAIFNASGRIVWGRLMDLTSFRVSNFTSSYKVRKGHSLTTCLGSGSSALWLCIHTPFPYRIKLSHNSFSKLCNRGHKENLVEIQKGNP